MPLAIALRDPGPAFGIVLSVTVPGVVLGPVRFTLEAGAPSPIQLGAHEAAAVPLAAGGDRLALAVAEED